MADNKMLKTFMGYEVVDTAAREDIVTIYTQKADASYVDEQIVDVKAQMIQQTPLFAESVEWLEENGDTSKVYILPDTEIYAYMSETSVSYTNVLDVVGYTEDMRISVSGGYTELTNTGTDLTKYISATFGDTVFLKNITMPDASSGYTNTVYLFDADKNGVGSANISSSSGWSPVFDDNGNCMQFTIPASSIINVGDVSYIRINATDINENSIITVNEEIESGNSSYINQLENAVDTDGSLYNGGLGYKDNTRFSTSSQVETTATGWDLTGFIPFTRGGTVRMKNMTFLDLDGTGGNTSRATVYFYDSYKAFNTNSSGFILEGSSATGAVMSSAWNPIYGDNGDIIQFTIPTSYDVCDYIRIGAKDINEDSIITVNEEIPEDTLTYKWQNTGHAFVPQDYEDRIISAENRLNALEKGMVAEGVPTYWTTTLNEGVQSINTALLEAGYNKSAFLFYSDAHWNYGSQKSPSLLKYLYNHTGMNKTFFGGDIVNNEADDYDTMAYLWDWRNKLKDLPNHHSVVGNHDDGNTTNNLFDEKYVYGYLLAAEETPDIVRGESGLYYYIDSPSEKTRYLFLDTAFKGADDAQLAFIKEALISTKENWHIVVVAHIWYNPDYDAYYNQGVRPMPIAGLGDSASKVIALLDAYNSRTGDYVDCKGWVEFCIGGHVHIDYDGTTDTGIPIILVETDSQHVRSSLGYTAGTTTEASVNGIIADYNNKKISVIRVGRGSSRQINY